MSAEVPLESIFRKIEDPAVRIIAEHSLQVARKALDMPVYSQLSYVVDEIDRKMPKALKQRTHHEITQD